MVKKAVNIRKMTKAMDSKKKTLKSLAVDNPERDEDLKEYLNRKDFHSFELELLMNDYSFGDEDENSPKSEEE